MHGYLSHSGVKGMKWGVQNGPPYPLDKGTYKKARKLQYSTNRVTNKGFRPEDFRRKHTIPKGTTIYRTTANPNETVGGPTYVSYVDSDRNHYKGGWVRQTAGGKQTYENTYTLTEDLVVPSRDELYSVIYDKVKDNKENIRKTCEAWLDFNMPEDSVYRMIVAGVDKSTGKPDERGWKNYVNDVIDDFGNKTLTEAAYYTAQSFGLNNDIRDDVIKELKNRGYNAMTDEASVGGQNGWGKEGIDPLIVFDSSVLYKQSSKPIDIYSERVAEAKWEKWTRKADKTKGAWSAFDIYSDELYHYGIKGQKRGIRRFQNLDRTWTEEEKNTLR